MAKGKKFFLEKAKVNVCNSSAVFFIILSAITFVEYRYAFKARSITDDIPFDILTTYELVNLIPTIGYKIRQINTDQVIGNTTSLYHHLDELRYVRMNFNTEAGAFSLLSSRVKGPSTQKKMGAGNLFDVQQNDLGLGFNILHLHLGDNLPSLEDDQKKLDEYIANIFGYFRVESQNFLELLSEYYIQPLSEYAMSYYLFSGIKIFVYAIFIFRMYSAISVLNRVKISFEEYSRSKRGFPLFLLFLALCAANYFQYQFFHDFSGNTESTLELSQVLTNRPADLKFAQSFLFESVYLGTVAHEKHHDILSYVSSRIEKSEDKIFQTLKGNINKFSPQFRQQMTLALNSQFQSELQRLQTQFRCEGYFEFKFMMEDCSDFCETKLLIYDEKKQFKKEEEWQKESKRMLCQMSHSETLQQQVGIGSSVKSLKTHLRQMREEWSQLQLNFRADQTPEQKLRAQFEFMYSHYMNYPEAIHHNLRIHNDYLIKLLSKTYKEYQSMFDNQAYLYIFADLAIGIIFLFLWALFYFYLIKGLSSHKSKFQEVSADNN